MSSKEHDTENRYELVKSAEHEIESLRELLRKEKAELLELKEQFWLDIQRYCSEHSWETCEVAPEDCVLV